MQIKRLRLLGFKSFVEPTELTIERGLTGIVGPNGCGKSNLLEALRWVMGETSFKSMRASAMDDVIFSGTTNRPSRNVAEVMVTLDNASRSAPAEFNDNDHIEIVRRLERNAGSIYKVNSKDVRARDVKLLFEDAATGARSHALVRQGQIGEIVNAKPEKRRRVLEDAAGIAGLHSRRHEAELRLKAAEANLERLKDIMAELGSQMNALKRQARQTKRYREISNEISRAEAIALHLGWIEVQAHVEHKEQCLREIISEVALATQAETKAMREQAVASEALGPLREEEASRAAVLQRLDVERETIERERASVEQRHSEFSHQQGELDQDMAREHRLIEEAQDHLALLEREIAELITAKEADAAAEEKARTDVEQKANALAEIENALASLTSAIAEHKARERQLRATTAECGNALERYATQSAALERERDQLISRAPDVTTVDGLTERLPMATAVLMKTERANLDADEAYAQAVLDERRARNLANQQDVAVQQLETEAATIRGIIAPPNDAALPAVIDQVKVEPGFEGALGAALGDDLDASLDAEAPAHWRLLGENDAEASLPAGVQPLSAFVEAPIELHRCLTQIGVVNASTAEQLHRVLRPGQRLVTKEGAVWRWDGFVAGVDAPTAAAKRLAGRNRLAQIETYLEEARQAAYKAESALTAANQACETAEKTKTETRQAWRKAQNDETALRDELATAERRTRDVNERLAALTEARSRVHKAISEAQERLNATHADLDSMPTIGGLCDRHDACGAEVAAGRNELAEARALFAGLEQAIRLREERQHSLKTDIALWNRRALSAKQHVENLEARLCSVRAQLVELKAVPEQLAEKRSRLISAVVNAEEQRRIAADKLTHAENDIRERDQALRNMQSALSEVREQRGRAEAHLEDARSRRNEHGRKIADIMNCTPDACLETAGVTAGDKLPNHDQLERKIERLKADRERLGGVNLRAEGELSELSERHKSIEAEQIDLEQAIERIRQGISKLNKEGRRRLLEAFEEVNAHFHRLFTTLFGGGAAELRLVDSEDPLESGLELVARPPGKKPTVLSLLSGGEQALTAMSLIFAVFLTNPSPICVLDEVDAPLDDSNVDRYCNLLDEMIKTTDTKFLVITHHPMTMSRMDRLFGVTMAEKGVSQLVSVDLATAENYREAS